MKIIRSITEMQCASHDFRNAGKRIGFVPTMGALHEGHCSLVKMARHRCDVTVVSVFVNPTQFAPHEDLEKYPRPFEHDCESAEQNGCDILFAPSAEAMYPDNTMSSVNVGKITETLEGSCRPGHFDGVTTVVLKLFNIVMPHLAVFGQKDAQQAIILKRMTEDFNLPVTIIVAPTIREKDGLAMSSRNRYLTKAERAEAPMLYNGLCAAEQAHAQGEIISASLVHQIDAVYKRTKLLQPEYVAVVDAETLLPVETVTGKTLIAVACRTTQSRTRLIDNIILGGSI